MTPRARYFAPDQIDENERLNEPTGARVVTLIDGEYHYARATVQLDGERLRLLTYEEDEEDEQIQRNVG